MRHGTNGTTVVPLLSTPPWFMISAMSRDAPQFKLRMPLDLKDRVEASAKKNRRSLNAEITARLEESFIPRAMDEIEEARTSEIENEFIKLNKESILLGVEMEELLRASKHSTKENYEEQRIRYSELADRLGELELEKHKRLLALTNLGKASKHINE